ncbi:Ribosomal N-lysine methyltransferase 3 [Auxenochlorella protothecoides]|uniref:Ribosomal N-lysine methyltransferase 3 n=1 Tax=Auxenochlorella protothecoides TaxID=3075 RepID=A0A087SDB5_AUXPR|nr:Ribosomal N-lysine methyltransferase 3 [Auxenochlorella protothecoides]KFM23719.1 Ribosomal N-lysine methyltransferase 3 [Auxenochlorella protothecoides]
MEPQAKRAKADGAALLPGLTAWLDREGVWWDDEAMQIKESKSPNGSSLSIHSRRPLPAGHHLCTIPKDACLSVRNASCSDIIMEENMCSGLGLVMAVMHERLLGPKSRHGYFCSLPEREYLPVFWGPEELALLQGTELGDAIHDELDCVRSDYTDQIEPLIAKHGLEGMNYSFPAFQAAASLVASRAFKVDDAVGDAMVPLADVFNHKASVVALSDHSEASGSGGEGSGSPGASPGAGTMLTSQLVPPSFLANAEPELHGLRSANGLSLALEICIVDDEEGAALRILTASPIGEGREVHNTYGELGNRDLLEKYGFTLPENPHDSVTLELEALWAWGAARHGAREWEARRAFLDANTPWLRRKRYAAVLVSEVEWGFRVYEWRASLAGGSRWEVCRAGWRKHQLPKYTSPASIDQPVPASVS